MIGLDVLSERNVNIFNILTETYNPRKLKKYKVLEIGCGHGSFARQLCLFFRKYDAIDIDTETINSAKKQTHEIYSNLTFVVDNILDTLTQNKKYKIIFASNAIHYIGNLHILFENIYKLLKKNGICIILENKPEPKRWKYHALNIQSEKFDEIQWLYKKKQLDDTHEYILKNCDYRYIEGNYTRFYVIRKITRTYT
jgi:2-polyprenyl-3-methyl-5-hydroxy-6-metoxy-1,4-benzoquinol methylase